VRTVVRVAVLVALWLLAWGEASVANVVSGVLVAGALLVAFPPDARRAGGRVRLLGALRLGAFVARQLVTSNYLVAREILGWTSSVRTGVLAYDVQRPSDQVVTLMANVIALTPGTMTVEATRDPAVLYVHFLLLDDVAGARRAISRLEELAVATIGDGTPPPPPRESP
jgi:multicomponent Na+:H+ antiporter subunit E